MKLDSLLAALEAKGYEITVSNSLPVGVWTARLRSGDIDFIRPPRLYVICHGTSPLLAIEKAAEKAHAIETGKLRSPYGDPKPNAAPPPTLSDMFDDDEEAETPSLEDMLS